MDNTVELQTMFINHGYIFKLKVQKGFNGEKRQLTQADKNQRELCQTNSCIILSK